jgi:hypothetical protein
VEVGVEHCRFSSLLSPGHRGDDGRDRSCHAGLTFNAERCGRAGAELRRGGSARRGPEQNITLNDTGRGPR